jgi:hypothetical protein
MGFKPCSPPDFKLTKITPCCGCRRFVFKIINKTIRNSKFRRLSEATPYHHNVFTFTLFLPEGRAGVAWEPSNKMMLFLPPRKIKCLVTSPLDFLFESTIYLSFPSLSLSLSGVQMVNTFPRRVRHLTMSNLPFLTAASTPTCIKSSVALWFLF